MTNTVTSGKEFPDAYCTEIACGVSLPQYPADVLVEIQIKYRRDFNRAGKQQVTFLDKLGI